MNGQSIMTVAMLLMGTPFVLAAAPAHKTSTPVKPVTVTLHDSATVTADDNGFFTLGAIADITGGTKAARDRVETVEVGRAPIESFARQLDMGDVALKLRQAGINPDLDLVLTGATAIVVTTASAIGPASSASPKAASFATTTAPAAPAPKPVPVIHRGDAVTIVVQDEFLTVTADGQARDDGAVGDTIHVHRTGVMTDLSVQVVDAHTVQLEL
jgi:hypothetical protein